MRKYLTILFTALGGSMALIFLLTMVFNAEIVLRPTGITIGVIAAVSLLAAAITQQSAQKTAR